MKQTIDELLPRIDASVKDWSSTPIDLGTAENWLIREEQECIYKTAIQQRLLVQGAISNFFPVVIKRKT
jgi:hypothetical protein